MHDMLHDAEAASDAYFYCQKIQQGKGKFYVQLIVGNRWTYMQGKKQ